ncbi:MAG TPA: hypothetical protein PKC34_03440 [Pseudomonadales bacterium]|nr:hypothetical protein [Pseudomonadales bacterium]HNF74455.1 hypothetical protein [Pseudomonadales bacterium]HNH18515.1 hypothetical protein [Pseudomonadales bacterium]
MIEPLPAYRDGTVMVVSDAGPLIHLDELGCIHLLADFQGVQVPDAVWIEVERHRPLALQHSDVVLSRCTPPDSERVDTLGMLYTLHSGEYAALCQCLAAPRALLLTDDTAARLAAAALAISAHGTIGIVVRAMRRGQMDKAQTLAALKEIPQRTSLHIRRNLLAEIIQQVEAFPEPDARDGA